MKIERQQTGIQIIADLVFNLPAGVQQGGAGKDTDDTVQQGDCDDCRTVPGGRMAGDSRSLDAIDRQLQQPGYQEGKAVGADQKERTEKVAAAAGTNIGDEKEKLLNRAPCRTAAARIK